jgi:hypothetical protein
MEADHLGAQMRQDDSCLAVFLIDGARAPPSDIRAILALSVVLLLWNAETGYHLRGIWNFRFGISLDGD